MKATKTLQIDKNIPVPEKRSGVVVKVYPWEEMEVGDSFFVRGDERNLQQRVASSAGPYGKSHGTRYATRMVVETIDGQDVHGVRVWRIE